MNIIKSSLRKNILKPKRGAQSNLRVVYGPVIISAPAVEMAGIIAASTLTIGTATNKARRTGRSRAPAFPMPVAKAEPKIDRESRRQGLRMLMGLNNQRDGGPVDGLAFQEEQRAQW